MRAEITGENILEKSDSWSANFRQIKDDFLYTLKRPLRNPYYRIAIDSIKFFPPKSMDIGHHQFNCADCSNLLDHVTMEPLDLPGLLIRESAITVIARCANGTKYPFTK